MKIRLPLTFAILALCSVLVYAQQQATAQKAAGGKPKTKSANPTRRISKEETKKLAEAASQSRANLLSASSDYRESLEKLLELQRQDELRAAEMVKTRKELLALNKIAKRELEDGERALAETQGRIAETMKKIAEVDELVAEVNAAEELAKTSAERPGLYRSAELKTEAAIYGQTSSQQMETLRYDIVLLKRTVAEQDRRITELETAVKKISSSTETKVSEGESTEGLKSDNSGWKNPLNWDRIKKGMSEQQVISILGQPTSTKDILGGYRTLFYRGEVLRSGFVSGNLELQNDRVWQVNKPVF